MVKSEILFLKQEDVIKAGLLDMKQVLAACENAVPMGASPEDTLTLGLVTRADGMAATAQQAGEVCEGIRTIIRKLYGAHVARSVTIQYGGSMNPKNAAELLAQPDIDGGLIGGAALKPDQFLDIINAANQE